MRARRILLDVGLVITVAVSSLILGALGHAELEVIWQGIRNQPEPQKVTEAKFAEHAVIQLPEQSDTPLVFSETLIEEDIQTQLHKGAVVLPLGTTFGEPGNTVVTAHSSGTQAFGPYRSAFAQIATLEPGTEFTVLEPHKRYTYRVYAKEIVWPHEVDKLPQEETSTVTLVTCWPLWTDLKRLLVHAKLVKVEYRGGETNVMGL